ncbi:MAG: hypothetical protein CO109_02930, partial [Deltaproteobacteria bacterium CG_4_9_14_3_um_filter_65_9]
MQCMRAGFKDRRQDLGDESAQGRWVTAGDGPEHRWRSMPIAGAASRRGCLWPRLESDRRGAALDPDPGAERLQSGAPALLYGVR